MRLFLSSQDLGEYADVAREMARDNNKAAFIRNAQDDKPPEERNLSTPEKKKMFEAVGFEFHEIDLRDYFGKQDELEKVLADFGSVWCAGGNTFILRRALKASGFDEIIKKRVAEDSILYGGWSAGSCICAKSLHGIEHGDRPSPSQVPDEYPSKEIVWEGLGFIEEMIIPHCNMEWFIDSAHESENGLKALGTPYIKLNDGQVYVVDGEKKEILR